MRLTDFRVLSFDCYGTLIDWESGILAALQPLLALAGGVAPAAALAAFARHESAVEAATPALPYPEVLAQVHRRLARDWGVATDEPADRRFGASVADWPAFADSAASLAYLGRYYRLAILSNIDRAGFAASNRRLGVTFEPIVTAEDVGSYKPDPANFRALIDRLAALGHGQGEILHTAQSLFHDHAPARACGLATAWIDRRQDQPGWGATMAPPAGTGWDFRFASLAAMAEAHRRACGEAGRAPSRD
jgi:2-haloalkanoic acid dehalogenase type II